MNYISKSTLFRKRLFWSKEQFHSILYHFFTQDVLLTLREKMIFSYVPGMQHYLVEIYFFHATFRVTGYVLSALYSII